MNKAALKSYAPAARLEFIQAVTDRAKALGLSAKAIEPAEVKGDVAIIAGQAVPKDVAERRVELERQIRIKGFEQLMEEVAYTWFNRFCALRFMEVHDYLDHGYRVLSNPSGSDIPEILEKATSVDLPGLDKDKVAELRLEGDKDAELYRMLLVKQCNALHRVMPTLFEKVGDATELLLPENLLQTNSPIRKLVNDIPEDNWDSIEIVGWLYQFYIIERRKEVFGAVVESKDIPAATQLFTPNWIVKYMVQNTVGRKWLMTYPASALKNKMEFYIEPAEQEADVQAKLDTITPKELNPEELTFMDPACGSGHILAEAYDLFKEIYLERGYRTRDIPRLILERNLYGLDIDDRAVQLARFTVLMKARKDDRRILDTESPVLLNILAIQESKGLNVEEAANVLLRERVKKIGGSGNGGELQLYLIQPTMSQATMKVVEKPNVSKEELYSLLNLFENGKTFGSLLTVHDRLKDAMPRLEQLVSKALQASDMESRRYAEALLPLVKQSILLDVQYDFVVANPPYMGSKGINPTLKKFANYEYPMTKSDLFAMFIERCLEMTKENSASALITMQSWMFLSSYEDLRIELLRSYPLHSMLHLGPGMFDHWEKKISQHTCFVFLKIKETGYKCSFYSLVDGRDESSKKDLFLKRKKNPLFAPVSNFKKIPGSPIAYWVSDKEIAAYANEQLLGSVCYPRKGLDTGENDKFLRRWHEVSLTNSCFDNSDHSKIWFPYNKGGDFRRWYGNREYLINWQNDGFEIRQRLNWSSKKPTIRNADYYFREGFAWSTISSSGFSVRYSPPGALFDNGGCTIFADSALMTIGGFVNTKVMSRHLEFLSPTLNFQPGDISRVPFPTELLHVNTPTKECIAISWSDWDAYETSWNFSCLPLLNPANRQPALKATYKTLRAHWSEVTMEMQRLEEEINRIFIEAYDLQNELESQVPLKEITLTCNPYYRYDSNKEADVLESLLRTDTATELISYAIGCMMGRYSLDEPGLIYAHSGNEGFDPSRYTTFPADEDGIVPVMDDDWFEDDATNRFEEFLKVAWSPETLDENLKFIADSLDSKCGEAPIENIRRFISTKFFKAHHLKVYKKRPIYWLFSSGKHKAFECLVYLHRYNENILPRMRAMYVTPLQGKFNARIEYLRKELDAAPSTAARKQLQKELDTMSKKQQELRSFDELLRHYADQRITLDLDDGVKINYGKFGELLAEVKAITGGSEE